MENVYVVGHKNPDTDSVCSSISLAYLWNRWRESAVGKLLKLKSLALPVVQGEV
ncbi:MAG: DHH family phosphoesterase, partial [Archaeoglobaceae archaeon]|nr:DHH family phosphoesterase [Archaeoglobaceae archaeon]